MYTGAISIASFAIRDFIAVGKVAQQVLVFYVRAMSDKGVVRLGKSYVIETLGIRTGELSVANHKLVTKSFIAADRGGRWVVDTSRVWTTARSGRYTSEARVTFDREVATVRREDEEAELKADEAKVGASMRRQMTIYDRIRAANGLKEDVLDAELDAIVKARRGKEPADQARWWPNEPVNAAPAPEPVPDCGRKWDHLPFGPGDKEGE